MKMTKMEWNNTTNVNMDVLGIVCQLIYYFPNKQELATSLPWQVIKGKHAMHIELVDTIFFSWSLAYGGGEAY